MTRTAAPPARPPEPDGPRQVSKFEFNLLRILRFMVGHFPADQGLQLVRTATARPDCLSPEAVRLVKDTLAKACVLFLVRQGGWRNDKYLRGGLPTPGRVWDRIPLDERSLTFSPAVLDFLIWATAEKVAETRVAWDAQPQALTPADELFFWLALDAIRSDPDLLSVLRRKNAFRQNPLCWISFPGDMTDSDEPVAPDFAPLFVGQRAVFLECLQSHLAHRWLRSEQMKGQIGDWKRMRRQGRAEFVALAGFLKAAGEAARLDLSRFVLKTNAAVFTADMTPVFWTGGLQGSGPPRLADRLDTQRAALALPRQMDVLEGWQRRALGVGYFDDDYQASQLWKADWEAAGGDHVAARARATIEMLEPLRGPVGGQRAADGSAGRGENPEGAAG
jgi:FtsH ternary system-associated peptide